jgi:alginate O-acetyltransferase complex protein AlgJ
MTAATARFLTTLAILILTSPAVAQRLDSVPPGKDGWLFHQDEFGFYRQNDPTSTDKALEHIVAITKLLASRDIELVLALVPTKTVLYPEQLPDEVPMTPTLEKRYDRALTFLRSQGVTVVDLKTAFQVSPERLSPFPPFQRLDHHWSSSGVSLAATTVAEEMRLQLSNVLDDIPTVAYKMNEGPPAVYTEPSLLKFLDEDERQALFDSALAPEQFIPLTFERITPDQTTLFSASVPEIVLVGSSFSKGESGGVWPFHRALQHALSKEMINAAQVGKGPWIPLSEYLQDDSFQLTPPRIIIWEFWELFLEAFGQARLAPEWLLQTSVAIGADCSKPEAYLERVRSNDFFTLQDTLNLVDTSNDSYLAYELESATDLTDYFEATVDIVGAQAGEMLIEASSDNWQRLNRAPLRGSTVTNQRITVPLFPEAGTPAHTLKFFPGETNSFRVYDARLCKLPTYVTDVLTEPLKLAEARLVEIESPRTIAFEGLMAIDPEGRWATGPITTILFWLQEAQTLNVSLDFYNPIEGQQVELVFNDQNLDKLDNLAEAQLVRTAHQLSGVAGLNRLELRYSDWNGHKTTFATGDDNPLAIYLKTLTFTDGISAEISRDSVLETAMSAPMNPQPPLDFSEGDLILIESPSSIVLSGLSEIEDGDLRWAVGPESSIDFWLERPISCRLDIRFFNPIDEQTVEVVFNGEIVETLTEIPQGTVMERSYNLIPEAGQNNLTLNFSDWNKHKTTFAPEDRRPMAIMFSRLQLQPGDEGRASQAATEPESSATDIQALASLLPLSSAEDQLALVATSDEQTKDLDSPSAVTDLQILGLSPPEEAGYRWSLGPETLVSFQASQALSVAVELAFFNPIIAQSLTAEFNGAALHRLERIDQGTEVQLRFFVNAIPGQNRLSLRYGDWNGHNTIINPDDPRPMGVLFHRLSLVE